MISKGEPVHSSCTLDYMIINIDINYEVAIFVPVLLLLSASWTKQQITDYRPVDLFCVCLSVVVCVCVCVCLCVCVYIKTERVYAQSSHFQVLTYYINTASVCVTLSSEPPHSSSWCIVNVPVEIYSKCVTGGRL